MITLSGLHCRIELNFDYFILKEIICEHHIFLARAIPVYKNLVTTSTFCHSNFVRFNFVQLYSVFDFEKIRERECNIKRKRERERERENET